MLSGSSVGKLKAFAERESSKIESNLPVKEEDMSSHGS